MKYQVNQTVVTPLGKGVVQGPFEVVDGNGDLMVRGVLVRLAVNDVTRRHLNKTNCLTPRANLYGLWVFQEGDLAV